MKVSTSKIMSVLRGVLKELFCKKNLICAYLAVKKEENINSKLMEKMNSVLIDLHVKTNSKV